MRLRQALEEHFEHNVPPVPGRKPINLRQTPSFERLLQRALMHVEASGKEEVDAGDVLAAIRDGLQSLADWSVALEDPSLLDPSVRKEQEDQLRLDNYQAALEALQRYRWKGNIRELRNAVERAMLLVEGDELTTEQFPMTVSTSARLSERVELPANGIDLEQLERSLVVQALERSSWNQTRAATLLGLNRDQIRYRIEKFKLEKPV